jgi:signal peptidase I
LASFLATVPSPTSQPDSSPAGAQSTGVRRASSALGRLVTGVLFGLVLVAGFVLYGMIDNRWYHVVAVEGGSMAPTIQPGDLIVITRPPARIEAGMILTLEVDGAVVTHRVVEVHDDGTYVTQGDANTTRDDFRANRVRVVGEYRFRIPWIGRLLATAQAVVSGAFLATSVELNVDGTVSEVPAADDSATQRLDREPTPAPARDRPTPTDPPATAAPSDTSATPDPGETATPSGSASPDPSGDTAPEPTLEPTPDSTAPPAPEPTPSADPQATEEPGPEATAEPSLPAPLATPEAAPG